MWSGPYVLAFIIFIFPGVGCASTLGDRRSEAMPEHMPKLVGNWEKITHPACSDVYPDRIQFQEGELYSGQKDPSGTFTQWDVGTYKIASPRQIKISTANDAIITYEFSVSDDVLTFIDPDGCEFKYRRVT
jgi:hypothetical protein